MEVTAYENCGADYYPAPFQIEEYSRFDLDDNTTGVMLAPHGGYPFFAMTANKAGILRVLPPALGGFQSGNSGLTSGTSPTMQPFQVSRYPSAPYTWNDQNYPTDPDYACPVMNNSVANSTSPWRISTGASGNAAPCDEVHSMAWVNWSTDASGKAVDYLFIAPLDEPLVSFQGTMTPTSSNTATYTFGTSPSFDPCVISAAYCTTNLTSSNDTTDNYPKSSQTSAAASVAIAASGVNNATTSTLKATLWSVVPISNTGRGGGHASSLGALYAYQINSDGSLTDGSGNDAPIYYWNSYVNGTGGSTPGNCSGSLPINAWFAPAFTQPTLAGGKVYVATVCAAGPTETTWDTWNNCGNAAAPYSGIVVYQSCTGN